MTSFTNNFNDTSEYMFRNSSTRKGGFEGNVGTKVTNVELGLVGVEDIIRTGTLLTDDDRANLRASIASLETCTVDAFCNDKADLVTRAGTAWDRAVALYPAFQTLLDAELLDIRTEMLNNINLSSNQWARTAGSSLNCLVQEMTTKSQIEIARRMAGQAAESLRRFKEHETQAILQAFEMQLNARARMQETGLTGLNILWGALRGSETTEVTDRDYTEDRNEDTTVYDLLGRFYHEGVDIADNDGAYNTATDAIGDSLGVASIIPLS